MPPCNGNIFTGIISKSVSWFTLCKKFGSVQHQSVSPDLHPVPPPDCYDWSVTVFYQRTAYFQLCISKAIGIRWSTINPPILTFIATTALQINLLFHIRSAYQSVKDNFNVTSRVERNYFMLLKWKTLTKRQNFFWTSEMSKVNARKF